MSHVLSSSSVADGCAVITLPTDCSIKNIEEIRSSVISRLPQSGGISMDVSAVENADVTFVQLVASISKSLAPDNLPFVLTGASERVQSAFARAGVALPTLT